MRWPSSWKAAGLAAFVLLAFASTVNAVAVMSVDIGSEWMKVAVVSPGVPMEIVLNIDSKRKTATAVAFRDGERSFEGEAENIGVKFPHLCYKYFLDLLGKRMDHPSVKSFQDRYPHYKLEADPVRGTAVFRHNETTTYSPEELLGMLIGHAQFIAERFSGQRVKDAVLTVPPFFGQAERRAVMDAAALAEVNVLQLINEHMAVALNYGMFRRKELNNTAKHIMFYNMGASSSWATIVSFAIVKTKERGFSETHPQAQVVGLAYDRSLGGLDLQLSIQGMIADRFSKVKKTSRDPRQVPRAMGKMFKEAGKVKLVLSANKEYRAQIENVMDDEDLKIPFTRDEIEQANSEWFEKVTGPMSKALSTAGMGMKEIDQVILFGGGTRVPKVQDILTEFIGGQELGKSLNTDEAAAMGAVYKAADLSSGFKVKKFITRDAVVLPIDVDFKRKTVDDWGLEGEKVVKRALFGVMNNYPQKKIMTFNKFTEDFNFAVNLNNLDHLENSELANIDGYLNLTSNRVTGVSSAFEKNTGDHIETKGIKAHFNLDDSGMLVLDTTEAVFEKNFTVAMQIAAEKEKEASANAEVKAKEAEETWAKLGDKLSSFWGGEGDEKKEGGDEAAAADKKEDADKKEEGDKKAEGEGDKKKSEEKSEKEEKKKKDEKKKKEVPKKDIVTTIKEPLKVTVEVQDLPLMSEETKKESAAKLKAWADHDKAKAEREMAFNDLESACTDMEAKLWEDIYEKCSTEEEREKIRAKCSEVSNWLYDEYNEETELSVLKSKLKEVKDMTAGLKARVREQHDRPEALEALKNMMNTSKTFYGKAANGTGVVDGYFTQAELDALGKLLNETEAWIDESEKKMSEEPLHQMPTVTASKIAEKGITLDREVKFLVNKARIAKRKADDEAAAKAAKDKADAAKKKKKAEKAANETEEADAKSESESASEEKPSDDASPDADKVAEDESAEPKEAEAGSETEEPEKETTTAETTEEEKKDEL